MPLNVENTEIAFAHKSDGELKLAHWLFRSMGNPTLSRLGINATLAAFKLGIPIKGLIKKTIFNQFCGGETLEEADKVAQKLREYGVSVIMDYGVEGKSDEAEFEKTTEAFKKTILFASDKPYIPFISLKVTGFARFELLEKIHAGISLTEEEDAEYQRVWQRVDSICKLAAEKNKMILIDAEESWIQQPVDDMADAMMERYNQLSVVVYNTFQLYRHDRLQFMKDSHQRAVHKGYKLGAKLVRGAYMEKERARALAMDYASPIQPNKQASDRDYDLALAYGMQHLSNISLFVGTHNEQSCIKAAAMMEDMGIEHGSNRVYFSQLFGMSDNISFNLAKEGYQVSKYLPYGPVKDVVPYLMRRAQENTSVAGQTGRELSLIKKEVARRRV